MTRARRTSVAVLLSGLLLGSAVACSGSDSDSPKGDPSSASATRRDEPYAATLELQEQPGQPSPAPGQPLTVVLTNTGKKKDEYALRVDPLGAGGANPRVVKLAPGDAAELRVVVMPRSADEKQATTLTAVSRARSDEVATLELPVPERPAG